jgi:glycosyltransferase involved in cell wall biosynthesis/GT2 family glycosyltransferase
LTLTDSVAEVARLLASAPSPVVAIPVYESYEDVVQCYASVLAHTPADVAVLVVDDCGGDRRVSSILEQMAERLQHQVVVLVHDENAGFVRSCNDAFAGAVGRDVVIVNSDVIVGPEWLVRLRSAAYSSTLIATVSTLTNHGTILSVPTRNLPRNEHPHGQPPDEAARRVAHGSLQLRPILPTAIGHCMYIKRDVIDLIGGFDETFSPGYGEEIDFSQRAVMLGYRHVCADDVFTYHKGGSSFGRSGAVLARQRSHEAIIDKRYPWYRPWVERAATDPSSPLAQAVTLARRSLRGLVVGVDALCLGESYMGTQHVVVQTIVALSRAEGISRVIVLAPERLPEYARPLAELPRVTIEAVDPWAGDDEIDVDIDIVYRPYQVSDRDALDWLRSIAPKVVVNQLDVIAFSNPSYFRSDSDWLEYRDLNRLALATVDGVAFISESALQEAQGNELLPPNTPRRVVYCGTDPLLAGDMPPALPLGLGADEEGFLLCLGASYLHKNRMLALAVWQELRRRGWPGRLVLAGPTPPYGNSLGQEAELLLGTPERNDVITLGSVSDAEKQWLYRRCSLVLHPTLSEGFGLVPFEAAAAGAPSLSSRQGSLDEVLPRDIPVIERFDVGAVADVAWDVIHDRGRADEICEALRVQAKQYTWDATAVRVIELFGEVLRQPRNRAIAVQGEGLDAVSIRSRAEREGPSTRRAVRVDQFVRYVTHRPDLKRMLSPPGSRRQRTAREVLNRIRRGG